MAFGDFTVARAGTKRVLNSSGVLAEVAANVPAFEFNTDGTYRGLLVEPAGTNLALRSQEFDNASWSKTNVTVSANISVAPDGTTTADLVAETVAPSTHIVSQSNSFTSGTIYTQSFFVKKGTGATAPDIIQLTFATATHGAGQYANFNILLGTVLTSTGGTASIQDYGGGWYRISWTSTATATASGGWGIVFTNNNDGLGRTPIYTGATTSDVILWGAQLETGSVATSYIPTVASTANRVADSVTLTGASSLIGQTQGTLYAEVEYRTTMTAASRILEINDGTSDNRVILIVGSTNAVRTIVTSATVGQADFTSSTTGYTGIVKIALGYATNDIALYVNGLAQGTDTSATIPACSDVDLGQNNSSGQQINAWIRSVALFPSRLANATLASLTQ